MRHPDILPDPDEDGSDARREITSEHAHTVRLLLTDLAQFARGNSQPVYLTNWNGQIGQNFPADFESGLAPDSHKGATFIDEGVYVGENAARYTSKSSTEEELRLILCGEGGALKTGLLAELDLREGDDISEIYLFHPDLNIEHITEETTWDNTDPDEPYPSISETSHEWLNAQQVRDLRQTASTFHTV